jgi:hypothetical protein
VFALTISNICTKIRQFKAGVKKNHFFPKIAGAPLAMLLFGGKMNLKNIYFLLAITLTTLLPKESWSQTVPEGTRITDVRLNGSGCDMDKASVTLSPDLKDISIFFDNYVVEIGQGSAEPDRLKLQKDCEIELRIDVPRGWQMAFKGVDYRGFVSLSDQGTAFQRFSVLQEGAPIISMKEAFLKGPLQDDYYVRSQIRPERVTWSKCLDGQTRVHLVSQLGVSLNPRNPDRSFTQIALDSADTSIKQSLSVDWRRCEISRPDPRPRPPGPIRPEPRPEPRPGNPGRPPRY